MPTRPAGPVPSTMKAAHVLGPGPAESIRYGDLPVPRPGPTDVLVRVQAVVVDPVDTYVRSGRFPTPMPTPFVVGRDLVGTVVVPGDEALPFRAGDRVWCNSLGHGGRQGSFAEYAVVPVDRLYSLPQNADPETAVAVAHPAATAYLGWFVHGGLRPGQTVYVGGAAGNVGTAAVQLAVLAGARVVAGARPEDADWCREAGAEAVVDYRDPELGARLAQHAPPGGLDLFWDTSGHHDLALVRRSLRVGGTVLVTAAADAETPVPFPGLYTRDVRLAGFVISNADVAQLASAAALVNRMLAAGLLRTRIADRLGLAETAEAHRRIEAGGVSGRLLLHPAPEPAGGRAGR